MQNIEKFADLVAGISEPWLCEFLKINAKTIKRWKAGTTNAPHAVKELLKIKLEGNLSTIGGEGWKDFELPPKNRLPRVT